MQYGCIGEKLGHSFSKVIHNELAAYTYELKELSPEALPEFMRRREFKAINVTIPYKQAVIPFLQYIDPVAQAIGAVNTIVNKNGVLYGYNTDYYGLKSLLERQRIEIFGKKVLILGSGGTSKTALAVARDAG
ncbi:MAG: shikimate dehydrogenase, partial [Clostridia bacterium]|nr:shikimate dehydrogenase [Clostridia bacterium]